MRMKRNRRWVDQVPVFCLGTLFATAIAFVVVLKEREKIRVETERQRIANLSVNLDDRLVMLDSILAETNKALQQSGGEAAPLLMFRRILAPNEEWLERHIRVLSAEGYNTSKAQNSLTQLREFLPLLPEGEKPEGRRRRVVLPDSP